MTGVHKYTDDEPRGLKRGLTGVGGCTYRSCENLVALAAVRCKPRTQHGRWPGHTRKMSIFPDITDQEPRFEHELSLTPAKITVPAWSERRLIPHSVIRAAYSLPE